MLAARRAPTPLPCSACILSGCMCHMQMLSENALEGPLPEAWGDLTKLTDLWVDYNKVR